MKTNEFINKLKLCKSYDDIVALTDSMIIRNVLDKKDIYLMAISLLISEVNKNEIKH